MGRDGRGSVRLSEGNVRDDSDHGNVLCLDCINVNILLVILFYNFIRCYHWGNWGKGTMRSPYYVLQLHENLQLSLNKSFLKITRKILCG